MARQHALGAALALVLALHSTQSQVARSNQGAVRRREAQRREIHQRRRRAERARAARALRFPASAALRPPTARADDESNEGHEGNARPTHGTKVTRNEE